MAIRVLNPTASDLPTVAIDYAARLKTLEGRVVACFAEQDSLQGLLRPFLLGLFDDLVESLLSIRVLVGSEAATDRAEECFGLFGGRLTNHLGRRLTRPGEVWAQQRHRLGSQHIRIHTLSSRAFTLADSAFAE